MTRRPFVSPNTRWEFGVALLDGAGWKQAPTEYARRDGKRLHVLFQAVNQPIRQKVQAIVKQACGRAGIDCELKSVVGSVYFSSDPGNVDTESHFYADLELSSKILRQPDPQTFMRVLLLGGRAEGEQVGGREPGRVAERRVRSPVADRRRERAGRDQACRPVHPRINDLVAQNVVVIPVFIQHAGSREA